MSDVIGRGVIETAVDNTKLNAGINDAKKSIRGLGDANKEASDKASKSIDKYIQKLQIQQATASMSARETELFKLALRGASAEQLKAADNAIKLTEAYQKGLVIGDRIKTGFIALAAASVAVGAGAVYATNNIVNQVASYQGLSEKVGDTASNIASLKTASDTSSVGMDTIASASVRLTSALSKTDDESKSVGAGISALGLDFKKFKEQSPVQQLDAIAGAMSRYADGKEKSAVATAIFGKAGADLIPFLNDLADGGERQIKLTDAQIKGADDYAKSMARLRSDFSSFLEVAAVGAVPILQSMQSILADIAKDETTVSIATEVMKSAMNGAVTLFQTIAVLGSDVGFVFLGLGREIGAVAAQLVALAHGDLAGFHAISDAVKADGIRAREELDKFQNRVMSIGESKLGSSSDSGDKPKISTAGLVTGGAGKADQIAKAQLAFDLDEIKRSSEAITNAYSNAEKIMQARRAAGLIDERDYYASKLGFIRLSNAAQESALQQEIARMEKEKLVGKDKIDNDRKIIDAQAKLAKIRENAAGSIEVLAVQEESAMNKIAQSYRDTEFAAQEYLDTIRKGQARELNGMGAGVQERNRTGGRAQIEDRYTQQRRELEKSRRDSEFNGTFGPEAQKKYDEELDRIRRFQATALSEYDIYFAERLKKEGDWSIGASEAIKNYYNNSRNVAQGVEELFSNAFHGMEDAIVEFAMTGKASFGDMAKSIIADIIRIQARQAIAGLVGMATSMFGGGLSNPGAGANGFVDWSSSNPMLAGRAIGGPVSANSMYRVNEKGTPEIANIAGNQYLLTGSQGGSVSPVSSGGGGISVVVHVDASGTKAEGNTQQANELGAKLGNAIRAVMIQEKMPGGILTS